jgi:hypothetical protein
MHPDDLSRMKNPDKEAPATRRPLVARELDGDTSLVEQSRKS